MRKQKIMFVVISLWSVVGITSASIAQGQKNVLAINPLGIVFGIQNVEYERALTANSGVALYWAMSGFASAEVFDVGFVGSEQRVSYRYYPGGRAPKGGWFGMSLAYSSGDIWEVDGPAYAYNVSMLAFSIEAGVRAMTGSFNIAPLVMLRLALSDNLLGTKRSSGDVDMPFAGFGIGINIGWGW